VNPEWVEKAARAVYAAAEHRAECDGTIDSGDWEEWDPENPFFSELLMEQRIALAAVLPEAMAEAWKQGALTADPNLDPSAADDYNPYEEDKS
jgi:hypothetical protein